MSMLNTAKHAVLDIILVPWAHVSSVLSQFGVVVFVQIVLFVQSVCKVITSILHMDVNHVILLMVVGHVHLLLHVFSAFQGFI